MTAVIIIPIASRAFAKFLMPEVDRVVEGGERLYLFCSVSGSTLRATSYHGLGGELLLRMRAFSTLQDADAWVRNDMREEAT